MQFQMRLEGPSDACGQKCRTFVSATGAITADTPREFETFAKTNKLNGALIALDSDGGSVLGAMALGRAIRKLGMVTTVGKTVDLPASDGGMKRARLAPRAYCESMCAFVLLAGVQRQVPAEARVLVHQIWLGDRRDDPTAANYSAEDLVLVQRDIGKLAQYTMEMGGTIDLLEIALKIPPWEPMRLLSRDELRGMNIATTEGASESNSGAATVSPALANGARLPVNDRSWTLLDGGSGASLARKHPLTVEGDDIGMFELSFACGEAGKDYVITYAEQRRASEIDARTPDPVTEVEISVGGKSLALKLSSSEPSSRPLERLSVAKGRIPVDMMKAFADPRSRSLTIETASEEMTTVVRVGNAGLARTYTQLVTACGTEAVRGASRTELRREAVAQPR